MVLEIQVQGWDSNKHVAGVNPMDPNPPPLIIGGKPVGS